MSKAKKIISMLLSVALVLTVAPVSVFASAVNYTYGEITTSAPNFTVDTSATTEVIRVAAGSDSFSLGTTIVAATPSGIPSTSGTYGAVAYAGETPALPTVTFTIDGATLGETPSVSSSLGGNISFGEMTVTTSGTKTTYSWPISTGTASAGTDVVFTITYKVNGTTYTAYAFSHVENILVMNGFLTYKTKKNNDTGSVNSRHSLIVQYQSKNMYSQMCSDSSVSNRVVGYINYATKEALSGNALLGCGSETDLDSSVNAYGSAAPNGNITGDEVGALIKSVTTGTSGSRYNMCIANDSNRGEPKIYIDKRNENLRTLNFRMTMQAAEQENFTRAFVAGLYFFDYKYTWGERDTPSTGNASSSIITASNLYAGPSGSLYATSRGDWTMAEISGSGPDLTTTTESYNYSVVADLTSNDTGNANNAAGGMNIDFYVYNTTDLYNVYTGIMSGSGSYTTSYLNYISGGTNTSVTFNKGKNPQSSMYSSGWSAFLTAYQNAGNILVKPDTNQTEINNATTALINAYNGLSGYNANVAYSVKHYITGTTTEIIPSQDATYAAGTTVVARAATIEGYTVSGDSTKTRTLSGLQASESEAFYYTPKNYNITVYSNGSAGTKVISAAFDSLVDLSTLEYGTREYYTFAGWYYDSTFNQPASNFNMPASDVTLYGKWEVTPININCILIADGTELETRLLGTVTPSDSGPVSYYKPADVEKEGYLFVEYYTDAELTTLVNWPMSFNLGDSDATIYARMVDVNGRIVFETNGGTPVEDITFTAPYQPAAPTPPTKTGYSFYKWYYDSALTQEVDWNKVLTNNTGFVAYAAWTANQVTITFDMGTPASSYDTTTEQMNSMTGYANAPVAAEDVPADPVKFGYTFDHWNIKGSQTRYDFTNYPLEDVILVPVWNATSYSAFIDIDSYEKVSGQYVPVTAAQTGDIVTFRMKSLTNFYTGSSVFVFMYDSNFFELVDSDASAFIVNQNSEYISGINAKVNGVTNDSLLSWPDGLDSANYDAMMVTIDPTVTLDNYNTEPMSDGEWIVEFRLRVKDTATGSGKVYMDNAWTRTPDNVMGTMFYGWSAKSSSVAETTNNVVIPNLDNAYAIITIDESVTPNTTVKLDAKGGSFSDGSTTKTYTGRAEQEIVGYTSPTREGYTLSGWVKSDDDTVTWAEGYYTTEALDGSTFNAQWTAIEYDVNFYDELVDGTLKYSTKVGYETPITEPPTAFTKVGYVFNGWVDDEGVAVTLPVNCPLGGMDLYATWTPATDTVYKITASAINQGTGLTITATDTKTGTTGYTVKIVETVPDTPEAETIYVTYDELPELALGNYHFDTDNNPAEISATIAPDGSTVIIVNYIANTYTYTFDANGGQFSDGSTTKDISGLFQAVVPADQDPGTPTKDGYDFAGWNPTFTAGTTKFTRNQTFTAKWTAKEFPATFNANGGSFDGDESITEKVVNVKYGSAVTAPSTNPAKEGYNFLGWASTQDAISAEALGTMDSTSGKTYYAVYALADYTVTYYVDGVETYTETYHMGDAVTIRAAESKTGYTFSGWQINGADAADFTMAASDVVIEGSFTANTYDVILDANGGYFDGDTSVKQKAVPTVFDTAIKVPEKGDPDAPVRSGYDFLGWAATAESKTLITNFGNLTTVDTVTYYAVWNALNADYTVEIYYQDTTGAYPAAADESYTYTGLVDTTVSYNHEDKTGFTFDSANSVESGTVSAETPLVLVIKYIRNQYALSTDVDGTVTKVADYYYGAAVAEPDAPSKEGYTFTGWSNLPSTMPAGDMTVTATWQINQYNVKFYADEAKTEVVYDQNLNYGIEMPDPTAKKEGYTLVGWAYAGTSDKVDLSTVTVPAHDVEFVAIWELNQWDIVYRTVGGVIYAQYKVNYGEAPTVPENPTREGYTFTGWNPTVPDTMPDRNVYVSAQWQINQYTITFVDTDGTELHSITANYGDDISAEWPDDPEKLGYTFDSWDTEIPETMPAGDMTITAKWTVNQYTITFANTGDSVISPITQDYGTAITAPQNPTKTGYTFDGWDTEIPATMPAGDMTITAKWTVNQYTIIFADTGDTAIPAITQNYGTAITKPANPTKTGYTFDGWDTEIPATMPAGDMTITAKWTINQYTITFNTDGGTEVAPITQDYGTAITAPENPTKEGYTFAGWENLPATMPADNVTVTAKWTVNSYTVTWDVDGVKTEETYEYGATINAPADPEKTGYSFAGWTPSVDATMPARDVTYSATWTANTYDATFDANGGYFDGDTSVTSKVVPTKFNETIVVPAEPERPGYRFNGWDPTPATMNNVDGLRFTAKWIANTDTTYTVITYTMDTTGNYVETNRELMTGTTDEIVNVKPATVADGFALNDEKSEYEGTVAADNSLVLKVYIDRNSYTFKTVVDGKETATLTYLYGATIATPAEPAKEGYTFAGWSPAVPATMPADDVTVTAQWTINQYTITFANTGDSVIDPITQDYGTAITAPENPTKTGYTFDGWDTEIPATMPAGDMTITAKWTVNQYTITFADTGDSVIDPITQDYGTAITAPENPTKTGYTFDGWDTEIPATMPAGDMTITAKWTVNQYTITFADTGDSVIDPITQDYGTAITAPENPTKTGYTFDGWDTEIPATMPAGDMTITAKWTVNQYTITFADTGDSVIAPITQDYGTAITAPENPTKTGYTFDGWDTEIPATMPAGDMTITAKWTANTYNAKFIADGQEFVVPVEFGQSIADKAPVEPTQEGFKPGYTFIKWTPEVGIMDDVNGKTFTAVFEANTYSVEYIVNGKSVGNYSLESGAVIPTTVTSYTTPVGYEFDGWYTDEDMMIKLAEGATVADSNVILYASETAKIYDAVFDANGGVFADGSDSKTVPTAFDEKIEVPADPTKAGYTFAGWDPEPATMDAEGKTFTAIWVPTEGAYKVIYIVDDAEYEVFKLAVGQEMEKPINPYKQGWKFVGWAEDEVSGTVVTIPATMPAQNLTYYAVFSQSSFTVTYKTYVLDADGRPTNVGVDYEDCGTQTYNFGETIVPIDAPEIQYYTFAGWFYEDGTEFTDGTTMGSADLVLYAHYDRVAVKLIPAEGSTTVIERDGVKEQRADNTVTTEGYATPASFDQWFIYGLKTGLRDTTMKLDSAGTSKNTYVELQGDGYTVVTPVVKGRLGTGTLVQVYDNYDTTDPVEEFFVVIYGDIDGNSLVNTQDTILINKEIASPVWSGRNNRIYYLFKAANLDGNRVLNYNDGILHKSAISASKTINQVTGICS